MTVPLDAFIRAMAKAAKLNFERSGGLTPMFIYVGADGTHNVLSLDKVWDDRNKDPAFAVMRGAAKAAGATRCALVCEAWQLDGDDVGNAAVEQAWATQGSLKDLPGRREVIVIEAEDQTAPRLCGRMEIIRPEGRKPYVLALRIDRPTTSEGRLVGMLPVPARMDA